MSLKGRQRKKASHIVVVEVKVMGKSLRLGNFSPILSRPSKSRFRRQNANLKQIKGRKKKKEEEEGGGG